MCIELKRKTINTFIHVYLLQVFMQKKLKLFDVFNTLTLKQVLWKTKTFFKKLEWGFLGEITKIGNGTFFIQNCPVRAKANTNRIGSTK